MRNKMNLNVIAEDEEVKRHTEELNELINKNRDFLKTNDNLCKEAVLDFGRLVYRLENEDEITKIENKLSKNDIDDIDDRVKVKFDSLIQKENDDIINAICTAVKKMKKVNYKDI